MTITAPKHRAWRRLFSLAAILFVLVAGVSAIPVVREFQLRLADTYFRTTPPPLRPSPVVLVLIDDESLATYGRWPWSRTRIAELVHKLDLAGAQVIGLDILFSEPESETADRQLANALRQSQRTVIVDKIGAYPDGPHWIEPLPLLSEAAAGVGHSQAALDSDGLCRRFPLRELTINGPRLAFALEVARHVDAARVAEFLGGYGVADQDAGASVVAAPPVLATIAFRRDAFQTVSVADVLQQRGLPNLGKRPVLVGFGPTEISDRLSTPLTGQWPASGVEIHAQILDGILSGRTLHPLPVTATIVLLFLTCGGAVTVFRNQKGWNVVVRVVCLGAIVYFAGWIVFVLACKVVDIGIMMLAVVFVPLVVFAADFVLVERSVRTQMQRLREWLVQQRRNEVREDHGDLASNLDLLQELQTQLGSLYELHERLLEATHDAIAIFDAEGRLILQNQMFASLFPSHAQLNRSQELQAEIQWREEEPQLEPGKAFDGEAHVGDELFSVRLAPLPPTTLSPTGGTIWTLTSLKAREERDRSRAETLGFITHELRTPLTSIQGFAELMMQYPSSSRFSGAPETIFRESKRLQALMESYLDVLRLDSGARPLRREDVCVDDLVRHVFDLLLPLAASRQMKLTWQSDDTLAATGDPALLTGAVLNLVSNAIKYGEAGTEIQVGCGRKRGELVLSVHNYGESIDSLDLPRLFTPYYRGNFGRESAPGWGLGLAFVKRIADKHGGYVRVESSRGGTTFSIHLPATVPVAVAKDA
jgi:signal transduction histidine kinase